MLAYTNIYLWNLKWDVTLNMLQLNMNQYSESIKQSNQDLEANYILTLTYAVMLAYVIKIWFQQKMSKVNIEGFLLGYC